MEKRGNSKGKSWRWPVDIGLFLALGGKGSLTPDVCIVVSKRSLLFPNFNSRTDIFAVRQFIDVTRRRSRLTERGRRFFI